MCAIFEAPFAPFKPNLLDRNWKLPNAAKLSLRRNFKYWWMDLTASQGKRWLFHASRQMLRRSFLPRLYGCHGNGTLVNSFKVPHREGGHWRNLGGEGVWSRRVTWHLSCRSLTGPGKWQTLPNWTNVFKEHKTGTDRRRPIMCRWWCTYIFEFIRSTSEFSWHWLRCWYFIFSSKCRCSIGLLPTRLVRTDL